MGGLDWAGLPLVVELLGIDDIDALINRLAAIKHHRPPEEAKQNDDASSVD